MGTIEKEPLEQSAEQPVEQVDFTMLHEAISAEPALLHPTLSEIEESYQAGLGVAHTVNVDGRRVAVGYSRVIPLLTEQGKEELFLSQDFPDIYELGTVFVHPDYRGRGIAEELQHELIMEFKDRLAQKDLLILGTTKTMKVLHILGRLVDEGVDFYHCRHTEFPHIAPFTCVCNPDFGEGFQYTTECSQRVSEERVIFIREILPKGAPIPRMSSDKIPCTMFVSDRELAQEIDGALAHQFTGDAPSQASLVTRLKEMNYYT